MNLKNSLWIVLLVLVVCCDDRYGIETGTEPEIARAKNWFAAHETLLLNSQVSAKGAFHFLEKHPDWDKSTVHRTPSGTAIEVALDYDTYLLAADGDDTPTRPNVISTMLLFEAGPGDYALYLVKIYPDNPGTELDNEDFTRLNFGEVPKDFSGRMLFFDWNENFIGGFRIAQGVKSEFIAKAKNNSRASARAESSYYCYTVTTTWYMINCVGSICSDPVVIDINQYTSCTLLQEAPGGGGGGGEEGEGNDCYMPDPWVEGLMIPCDGSITNNVTNPCMKEQVENAVRSDLKNQLSALLQSIYNINDEINVTFSQATDLANDDDATADASGDQISPGHPPGYLNVDINLNANTLPNASQEYIMSTIYHEVVHAVLTYKGISTSQQHESMAGGYVTLLTNALLEHFPNLSAQDAHDLSWGGLQRTAAWNNLSNTTKNRINTVNSNHKRRIAGTPCN